MPNLDSQCLQCYILLTEVQPIQSQKLGRGPRPPSVQNIQKANTLPEKNWLAPSPQKEKLDTPDLAFSTWNNEKTSTNPYIGTTIAVSERSGTISWISIRTRGKNLHTIHGLTCHYQTSDHVPRNI